MDLFNKKKLASLAQQLENANRGILERDLTARAMGVSHGGKRDIYEIYGYPNTPTFQSMYRYSRREGVANRVVFGLPQSCWRDGFKLYTDDKKQTEILKEEIAYISKKMVSALERADALNRIGPFSCLFIGVPDLLNPKEPLGRVRGDALKAVYFRPFSYDGIEVYKWDNNSMSPRFGLPELYQLQTLGRGDNGKDVARHTIIAHHSRVVHICEKKLDSDIEGIPALEPVFNYVINLDKVCGGSAEAYFRNARGKTSFEIAPEFSSELIDNEEAKKSFDDSAKSFTNNWQDHIISLGSKVAMHNTPHASPLDTVRVNLWMVTTQTKIPIRILTGEGGGQLAGSEDKLAYNVLVDDRRYLFCEDVLNGALSILGDSGTIDLPPQYFIDWPEQKATTDKEKADIGLVKSQTVKNLVEAGSTIAGDGLVMKTAFTECYLPDIDIDDIDIDIDIDDIDIDEIEDEKNQSGEHENKS